MIAIVGNISVRKGYKSRLDSVNPSEVTYVLTYSGTYVVAYVPEYGGMSVAESASLGWSE